MAEQPSHTSRAGSLPLVGEVLALNFCNTSSGRETEGRLEHLGTWQNLLDWAHHAGIVQSAIKIQLEHRFGADPSLAACLVERAVLLREAIYRVASDLAALHQPDQASMDLVAGEHAACLAKGRLTSRSGGFGWTWMVERAPEESVLGPIAASAMALIIDADLGRLKQCQGHHCGWLFLDVTKSNNRRWCEMDVCGNRAKQRRRRTKLLAGRDSDSRA